jgi:peptidoglycan/xylan/chitin deacetylase (PgdA/CDA1 family)
VASDARRFRRGCKLLIGRVLAPAAISQYPPVITWKILLRWLVAGALFYSGIIVLYRFFGRNKRSVILNYHRILDPGDGSVPPGMYVRPRTFDKHLRYLKRNYQVVTMKPLVAEREKRQVQQRPLCAITFDDGWCDNYERALPLLRKYELPATLFVSTNFIGNGRHPWFYRLGRILHAMADIPEGARAEIRPKGRSRFPVALERWLAASPRERRRNADLVIEEMKNLPAAELELFVEQWHRELAATGGLVDDTEPAMLDWQQVREMADSLFEIGSHGVTHFILTNLSPEKVKQEAVESKQCIETQLGRPIDGFSYPNGDYSPAVEAQIRAAGYAYACTTRPGYVRSDDKFFQLKRIRVHDDVTFSTALFACHLAGVFKLV